MFDNLPDLIKEFPIGTKVVMTDKNRDDYAQGRFTVDSYVFEAPDKWYPAHKLWDGKFEVYHDK